MNALKGPELCSAPSKSGSTQKVCSSNITVVVRVRPANAKELEQNNRIVVDVVDDTLLVFDPKEEIRPFFYQGVQQPNKNYLKRANKELQFVFDQVFDQTASNKDVFEATTKGMLESLMEGYNCSVFVYGATGAGKTFTMIGSQLYPGITYLTMEHLFYTIHSFEEDREFDIGVSYIEIYNEHVYDLLKPSKLALQLREDNKYGVMVAGLTLHKINTARELLNMLENGNKNRTQHPTDANAESSRSHAVFQVYVKMRYKTSSQVRLVKLSMIDLAGSERAAATGCVGDRFKEGANINRSLLSLGNCINRLADGSNYIPYRDSKLTRLLKDSLGGNCKTIMIANVSPSSISYEDTYNTLKYAARANKIQLSLKKNIVDGDMKISQYVKINAELKKKVKDLEAKLAQASYSGVQAQSVHVEDGRAQKWRDRILMEEKSYGGAETRLLALMARARVLALRHRLRTRGAARVADLAHRSSTEAMNQIYNEDVPRQERAAEHYIKQSLNLEMTIHQEWVKWKELRQNLHIACERGLAQCPDLKEFITLIHSQSNERQWIAKNDLKDKLLTICYKEISAFTDYTIEMPNMLKKLYMTLKGHNFLPPTMTSEYLEIMKKAKSSKAITWSDTDTVSESTDHELKYICTLDLNQPISTSLLTSAPKQSSRNGTDSDLTDVENQDTNVETTKRKGTPIKLLNNETIIIDDSLEVLDASRVLNSAKKIKIDFDESSNKENNYDNGMINPKDLNSTFVLNGKMENPNKNQVNTEPPMHRGLTDRTNTIHRNFIFNDKGVRPKAVVGKALPQRRPAAPAQGPRVAGFGSSLARDGTPLQRNAFAVRERARTPVHPYSRPAARK